MPATVASAAPVGGPLYDATLFCGEKLAMQVDYDMPMGIGDTIWITTPGPFEGKWQHLQGQHFALFGTLASKPVPLTKLAKAPYLGEPVKVFGEKTGMTETATCQIVSRWPAGTMLPDMDLTVFGMMWLAH